MGAARVSPGGSDLAAIVHLPYGGTPPVPASVAVYGDPANADGSEVVVTEGAGAIEIDKI